MSTYSEEINNELTILFDKQLEQAFTRGVSSRQSTELMLCIILWMYLSDLKESIGDKPQEQKTNVKSEFSYFDKSANDYLSEIEQVFRKREVDDVGFPRLEFEIDKLFIEKLTFHYACEVLEELISFFTSGTWHWTKENIVLLFECFEDVVAQKVHAAHFYHTPSDISHLLVAMFPQDNEVRKIYDPFCRSGELLSNFIQHFYKTPVIAGKTMDSFSWKLAATKMYMLGVPGKISKEDALLNELSESFDIIVSNPPFGVQTLIQAKTPKGRWSEAFHTNRSEVEYLCHMLDHLAEGGKAAVIVPTGILFSGGVVEALRKQMVGENILEAVVMLPSRVFLHTGVKTAVLFIDKSKSSDQILLIDATDLGVKSRTRRSLSQADIHNIVHHLEAFRSNKSSCTDEGVQNCIAVSIQELERQHYDLQYSSYRNRKILPRPTLSSVKLWEECKELETQLQEVQREINAFHRRLKIDVLIGKT